MALQRLRSWRCGGEKRDDGQLAICHYCRDGGLGAHPQLTRPAGSAGAFTPEYAPGASYAITTILNYVIIAVGAMTVFGSLGVSWDKLQWLAAALSVGLGFGLQEIFGNFVSGLIILFERPVRIGDTVTIGTYSGTVSKIRIRATTITDFDRKEVIIPNKAFVTERLINWSSPIPRHVW